MSYLELHEKQKKYFLSGATRSYEARVAALKALRKALASHRDALEAALREDLNKQPCEAVMCETGLVMAELGLHIRRLKGWMKEKRASAPLYNFPSRAFLSPEPYGLCLIYSPWNYPLQLCLLPLIGAISAGNCAVLKPSVKAPATGRALAAMLADCFAEEYVAVVLGSREETAELLELPWDHIFFTGSKDGGKAILRAAAEHLTPVTLELGGKSPAIVDPTANLRLAARRIAFGKVLNAGQTCVAPDYLLLHESLLERFLDEYRQALARFFPKGERGDMVRIVNTPQFLRLTNYLTDADIAVGGTADGETLQIEPSVVVNLPPDAAILHEEVFGPILPVILWRELDWCIDYIRAGDKPLAMYIFSEDKNIRRQLLDSCSFGGGCLNDTVLHCASSSLPFGGVGASGMGSYHGHQSFLTFSHNRSILDHKTWLDLPLRYMPYTKLKTRLVRWFLK